MNGRERMLAACRCEEVDRPPIWLMRQAGRYLPEYMKLREQHSFWELMRTPALAREVALQPLRRYPLDATILFNDILVPLDSMGAELSYSGSGPVIGRPFCDRRDLDRMRAADIAGDLSYVGESMEALCEAVHPDLAVIGFAGAPLTLATYLVEGSHRGELRQLKSLFYNDPELGTELLEILADAAAELLIMQIDAGADMVQIFDSWSCYLDPQDYADIALPAIRRMIARVQEKKVPVALYIRCAASHIETAATSGCQVLSIDASLTMDQARARLPRDLCLQGNLDPAVLLAPPEQIEQKAISLIHAAGRRGHIVNVGQGLFPQVPPDGVGAFVKTVADFQYEDRNGANAHHERMVERAG